jgi:hypothetical protein
VTLLQHQGYPPAQQRPLKEPEEIHGRLSCTGVNICEFYHVGPAVTNKQVFKIKVYMSAGQEELADFGQKEEVVYLARCLMTLITLGTLMTLIRPI